MLINGQAASKDSGKGTGTQSRVGRREGGAVVEDFPVLVGEIRSIGNLSQPVGWDIAHDLTPNSRQQGTALLLERGGADRIGGRIGKRNGA